jgi:hypothetical protein
MFGGSTGSVNGLPPYDDLPQTVLTAFRDRTMLSMLELAAVLEMDVTTLRAHVAEGDISGRFKGVGRIKRRMVFTISDVAKYFRTPHDLRDDRPLDRLVGKLAVPLNLRAVRPPSNLIALMYWRGSMAVG